MDETWVRPGAPFSPLVAPTPCLSGPLVAPWGETLAGLPLEDESRAGPKSGAGVSLDRRGGDVGLGEHAAVRVSLSSRESTTCCRDEVTFDLLCDRLSLAGRSFSACP